jgi:hypothetical protein
MFNISTGLAFTVLLRPKTRLITQERPVDEVEEAYTRLVMG